MTEAKAVAAVVRDYLARRLDPVMEALAEFRVALSRLPAAEKGDRGEQGERGPQGERGEAGPPGKDGATGPAGEPGRDGVDGKDGAPGLNGVDGAPGVAGADGKDGRDGRDGADGINGRDATAIEYLDGLDESRSYPRGTHALYRGGVVVALRATDPLTIDVSGLDSSSRGFPAQDLTRSGWAVAMNGIHAQTEEWLDGGRTVRCSTTYTNGRCVTSERKTSIALYRGVWKPGAYDRGDMSTRDGSIWHCEEPQTEEEPGKSAHWKLAVKRGNNGRDGKDGERGPQGPEGKAGPYR